MSEKSAAHGTVLSKYNVADAERLFPADPELTQRAREEIRTVKTKLMPGAQLPLLSMLNYVTREVYATCWDTMAVALAADRIPVLGISPAFTLSLSNQRGIMFVLYHEALHLLRGHLAPNTVHDAQFTLAREAWINNYVMKLTGMSLPVSNGEPSAVDPKKVYADTKKGINALGISGFPDYDDFYVNEQSVYEWLSRLPKPPSVKVNFCVGDPGEEGEQGQGQMPMTMDAAAVGELVEKAISATIHQATKDGNQAARNELNALLDASLGDENAERIFGALGAYDALGRTTPERKINLWDSLARLYVGRMVVPSNKLTLHRKRLDQRLLVHQGRRRQPHLVVAQDASGSMVGTETLAKITQMIGQTNCKVTWLSFDTGVHEITPGDPIIGGGGTDASAVDRWIAENCPTHPDGVIVITDGEFSHFTPVRPRRWLWMITATGSQWPASHTTPMRMVVLPTN